MSTEPSLQKLEQLPAEMLEFALLKTTGSLAPRLGRLSFPGRKSILTPGFIGNTSRGVIPHISQDNFGKSVDLGGVYVALEDFVEKLPQKTPPIFKYEVSEPLRRFIALPQDTLLVLGARRNPPIPSPHANSNSEVGLLTSVGFTALSSEYYAGAARKLQPDIVVGLADIPFGQAVVGTKRKDKMSDRTETWLRDLVVKQGTLEKGEKAWSIFAPILPIERELQTWYLEHLLDDMVDKIGGIAIYDAYLLDDLSEKLHCLPRLSFHAPVSPQDLLRQVSLGIDVFTVPFVNDATDAGIVLDFTFPTPAKDSTSSTRRSLGIDMWSGDHAQSVTPLSAKCTCYACTNHHRAFLQHLLAAKEMLGWVLIQIHNHEILSAFFTGVRSSIDAGTFDADVAAFEAYYEPTLPEKTGQGPRVRGYQFKSESHAKREKKNPKAFQKFSEEEILRLKAAHGQRPSEKPEMRDVIDDEALLGLMSMHGETVDADLVAQLDGLQLQDDKKA
ncbi:Tgt Queuine archaeosine tRNA-ribosyltransferase [Pyrenophora tritici-repentis]|uniref:Queuine tRNA-ribosyltransferase accessory subunit 2 n=2 Tax=Pyrenophora tritici-repentis TaxID=45151 RepID=A0A2W1DL25_9PLEO|nr:Tgt Queuine-archaeosine tRNA-ribosyltransferase [Pyrenophora tritici-repentis]KAF7442838.1 Tgt Queuine-archaeosine tRNA-ribosyltransferase [Pyrenophora tritici-repentis]KAF7568708.1 Tgt, Queuine-archaeosine tRNA-ribosyltransferase [Pyrenophora tritici-repentis]KAG9376353.1 Tgt Queuine-archaeosine tRNA-ribosyltransferase [Pyrenophora tritici-repentis]KAI0570774.1 Tgt Queuine-archaeosine tRNA-ribosyltransferase [Pyrenophora tritici-repentis]